MILKYLVNTRNFYFSDDLKDYIIEISEIYIAQDSLWRSKNFFDKEGRAQIGDAILSACKGNDVYGTRTFDAPYITDKDGGNQIQVELMKIGQKISNLLDNILSFLWFIKDNSVSYDYTYAYAVSRIPSSQLPRPRQSLLLCPNLLFCL